MLIDNKKIMLFCFFSFALNIHASPLSDKTAEAFYQKNNPIDIIKFNEVNNAEYNKLAVERVNNFGKNIILTDENRNQAISSIEAIYKKMVESKVVQIKDEAIEYHKKAFIESQTEEAVRSQIQFLESTQGQAVFRKQALFKSKIENLYKELPVILSDEPVIRDSFKRVLEGKI